MVSTRACTVESKSKGKKNENPGVKDIRGGVKIKMEANNPYASCSNDDSEEEEQNVQKFTRTIQSGSALKVTLKKTRSCSSSSRESAQSFEVVKSVPVTYGSNNSGEEDDDDQKDSEHDELDKSSSSDKQNDDETMEKESDDDSQSVHSSGKEDDGDRTTGSPQESVRGQVSPADSDTEVSKLSINKVVDLKTEEIPQNSATVKTEEIKLKIKSLKEELLKEADQEDEVVILKEDYNNEQASKTPVENGVEKKEAKENVKEQKFKVNVRSFDDLAAPHTANLINMPPPAQIETSPNFLTQNGATFPPFINLTCNVCGITFDTSELLTEHKITLKHLKCSYKECEPLLFTSLQELMDHQRLLHNIMPSSVQQLEHQVQRLPTMGYEQQIQPGRPLTDNLPPPSGVPNMYTQTLRMPMQRGMRPIVRQTMPQLISNRGRGSAIMRGRAPLPGMMRGSMKRSVPMPVRQTPPMKRVATDRNNINSAPPIVKSLSESLTKSIGASSKSPVTQKDVVNLLGKRGLTISTVDTTSNISIPAGLSLNSAVSIIPTSPSKKLDTVDLTGPDKPRSSNSAAQYYPCVHCAKTFLTVDSLNEHISLTHKSAKLAFKCNLCGAGYPNSAGLNQHKQTYHKGEMAGPQYVIPVIDVNRPGSVARLQSLGITNYLPVGQLNHQGGEFGLPIMNIMRPGSLDGLGATNYFNLGPIKKFTKY
ncbi:uncharacterized protein LOC126841845 [Adelges cooleyi]|uniref:uncharacterized protein LOC126841845 n=1 Tax=Adelges cooleyi TaxID=133065 RepID=UPI0021807060|nr:uncharacterized protein LOC126841845 [Adelges cooleyi]XP_050434524.1 uncharacterized protein LOC126841845 [Adelges cooleyi]XP_050434525.1 uncharacterized protein LOC126841845 [Adelges cooleyi]XP_050434526.1 uncharacterized protein LOC126841845 [Adelges cooleyi]XP_050434527.1 uncharacterized protein LOC126841845 [Adelges cooleyi]XP_050434529.1 uncharacterized protein LOC126841845 [Adelges cooleyi]